MDQRIVEHLRRREAELARELESARSAIALAEAGSHEPESEGAREAAASAARSTGADHAALYGAILQSAIDYAIIAARLDGRIVEWNVGARNVLGWSQDEMVGRSIRQIFTPEDRAIGRPELEMQSALDVGYAMDRRWHMRRDGSRFWADGRMMALKGPDGAVVGYLKILRDETGQRRADTQTTAHHGVLRLITDTMDAGILQLSHAGAIIFANPAAERMLGAESADLHGRTLAALTPPAEIAASRPFDAVLRTRAPMRDVDGQLIRLDGVLIDVTAGYTPIIVDDAVDSVVVTLQDISQRRALENFMRAEARRQDAATGSAGEAEDAAATYRATVAGALRLLPRVEGVAVLTAERDMAHCEVAVGSGVPPEATRVPLDGSLAGTALRLARPLISEDAQADDRMDRADGAATTIALPFARRGILSGVLLLTAGRPGALTLRDMLVGQILAGHLATSLARADEAQALRKLRLSEERLQLALEASETIGIWDWDIANDLCYGDARFARLMSVDPALAAEGLPIAQFVRRIHPDDRVWLSIAARKAMAEGGEFAMEHRVVAPDGTTRWLAARGRSYNGPDGIPVRFPGAVVDITRRKRVEASLRDAETNARLAVRAAGLGLWEYDPALDDLVLDDRCRTILDVDPVAVPTLGSLMQIVHPRSRLRLSTTVQDAVEARRLVEQTQEFEIAGRDGGERWIELSAQPFFDGDVCARVIGTVRDITERRRLEAVLREDEQRFRALADSIPQLAWMATPAGEIHWFNGRWFDYTGADAVADLDAVWQQAHDPQVFGALSERMRIAFREGLPWEDTVLLRGADGTFRWFLSRARPMREADGPIVRWFGTHTDINDQVRAREAQARFGEDLERQVAARTVELSRINDRLLAEMADRQRAEDALRQSQKMEAVGQLTGGIAHDFNNLLTGITGSLDLMRKRIDQGRIGEIDRYINAAATSAHRAAALTHRLLAFARRQPLDAKPVDVNGLVASMEDMLQRSLGESIEIAFDLAGDLWTTLCDPHQLENALLNLVINARDAMPDGGVLTIATANTVIGEADLRDEPDRRPGEFVALLVRDTGTGMSPDVIARVFEPFFTTKPIGQGTGLGLSMIYGFARQSEGHIAIRSQLGEGTLFTLQLPRFRGSSDVTAASSRPSADPAGDGETVLVVEDDAVVRTLVLDLLKDLGYQTLEAHDGMTGLAVLQGRARIDLLVTDVGLPGLNGRQLAEMGRASRPDLKVLFITGYAEDAAFGTGLPDQATQMITKPFAVDVLAAKMREMLTDVA